MEVVDSMTRQIAQQAERRIARLIVQQCSNRLIHRITGESVQLIASVRRRLATIANRQRAEALRAQRLVLCVRCKNPVRGLRPEWHGLCADCRNPPTKEPEPTEALPGTPEMIEVYAARVREKRILWCEGDGKPKETDRVRRTNRSV
jgi:hypothetical protein